MWYFGAVSTVTLQISGMNCASCAARVETTLRRQPSVRAVSVNFATAAARVEFDEQQTSLTALQELITGLGYQVRPWTETAPLAGETEAADWGRRSAVGAGLTLGLLALHLVPDFAAKRWLLFALATPIQLYVGWPFFVSAWRVARNWGANMDVLVEIGAITAYAYSTVVIFVPALGHTMYFEDAAVILTVIALGRWLEARAKTRTSFAIRDLLHLAPARARVRRAGHELDVDAREILVGDVVLARPGDRIAVDGVVTRGESAVDESMLSGESLPVDKASGSLVLAGTLNQHGALEFTATKVGRETTLAHIVRAVQDAQQSKADIQRLADRVAGVFVPVVLVLAAATFCGWWWLGGDQSWLPAVRHMVAVLIIACPCSLGLATPTAIMVGTGLGARHGILIRDARALERSRRLDTIVFDKTGTLTVGKPVVTAVTGDVLALAASAEFHSEHPLGRAIVAHAQAQGNFRPQPVQNFRAEPGLGVRGDIDGQNVFVGRLAGGGGAIGVTVNGTLTGTITVQDTLKPHAREVVTALRARGLRVVLLTGDHATTARVIGEQAGIAEIIADVLPHEKAARIRELQRQGHVVAFVGDGINDAPALAQADVGIALGAGADIAKETSHITLVGGDLQGVVRAIELSRRTLAKIQQNLFWAFIYNVVAIPLAVAGVLSPMVAATAMAASSVSVVANALRLRWAKL